MGKKQDSYHQGWRSQTLAELLLSNISFPVVVNQRDDIGVDFFCTLYEINSKGKQRILKPGATFAIQVKSKNKDEITLSKAHINFLSSFEIPFFLCLVNRKDRSMEIYSCQQLLQIILKFGNPSGVNENFSIIMKPIDKYSVENLNNNLQKIIAYDYPNFIDLLKCGKKDIVESNNGDYKVSLEIGPLIFKLKLDELEKIEERNRVIKILNEWVSLDYKNKYSFKTYSPFTLMRLYDRGKLENSMVGIAYYNMENYEKNLYPILALRLFMLFHHFLQVNEFKKKTNTTLSTGLEEVLKNKDAIVDSEKLVNFILEKNMIHILDKDQTNSFWTKEWNEKLRETFQRIKKSQNGA
jgi:hypothetical protein